MYELKKLERYLRVNLLGPGPRLVKKRIYRAAVSQRLRNTGLEPAKFLLGDFKTHIAEFLRISNYQLRTVYSGQTSLQETDACV